MRGLCGPNDGQIHTDSKTKVITVLLYLNEPWAEDGGRLRVLKNGEDLDAVAAETPPDFGTLLAFRRSDHSWHGHKPYVGPRRVVQMNWVTSERAAGWQMFRHRLSAAVKRLNSGRPDRAAMIADVSSRSARSGPPPWLLIFLAVITALRLSLAAAIPLTEDEAYYRLWAASPQFGYYDHPPMIAWWIRVGMSLAGDNAFGMRLVPTLACGVAAGLMVFDLAVRPGRGRWATAARASLWYNATFLIGMGGTWRRRTPRRRRSGSRPCGAWREPRGASAGRRWWLGGGVAAGLACLSKYSALFLALGVVIWLLMSPERSAPAST